MNSAQSTGRNRAYSIGSIQEITKRKREKQQEENLEQDIFKSSKKIAHSPRSKKIIDKTENSNCTKGNMDNNTMQQQMGDMANTLKIILEKLDDIREIKNEIKEIRVENKQLKDDLKTIKNENSEQIKQFQDENNSLKQKINNLEMIMEKRDKIDRKNNLIIKGTNIEGNRLEKQVENLIKNKLGVDIEIKEAYEIKKINGGQGTIIAKLKNWEDKQEVLKNKNKLKGEHIFIDNDLTAKEREIQKKLRDMGKMETAKGHRIRIGYKKIFINGIKHEWNDKLDFLQ